ncbi:MAG: signal peptidase II [Aquificaceae bacterium]|nr:signal peptidase II [Aquificaceae bacterium]
MGKGTGIYLLIYGLTALGVLALDLYTKSLAEVHLVDKSLTLLPFLHLLLVYNRGVAFGLFSEAPDFIRLPLLLLTPLLALILTLMYTLRSKNYSTALLMGMVGGGALGNFYDRALLGHVRDFIYLSFGSLSWPAFNLADASISTAIVLFLLRGLLDKSGKG